MTKYEPINISFLGDFSFEYDGKRISDNINRSKKLWALLEYIATFRDRYIPKDELIGLMWEGESEDSSNPGGALKTMLHRIRVMLEELNYPHDIILQGNGSYYWNSKIPVTTDIDDFEKLANTASNKLLGTEDRLTAYMRASELYRGDFLLKNASEAWIVPISTYYHSLFLSTAYSIIELLDQEGHYAEMEQICAKAVNIDKYDESLHYYLIKAQAKQGNYQAALNHYEYTNDLLYRQFGVNPSKELTALYREIVEKNRGVETDLVQIKDSLKEAESVPGAFFCQYEFFKDIYRLESRAAARTGSSIYISLVTITDAVGSMPQKKLLNKAVDKLSESIKGSLRRGDVYARYSVSQFIIMMPSLTYENGEMVMQRIVNNFRKKNPKLFVYLNYKLQPLEPSVMNERQG